LTTTSGNSRGADSASAAYSARYVSHVREVSRSVTALRRADGYEEDVNLSYDLGESLGAGKVESSCALGDELLEAGLVERDPSLFEACQPFLVVVQACHTVSDIGKTRPRRQPDVARSNDTHSKVLHETRFPLHAFGSKPTVHNRDITGRRNTRLASTAGPYASGLVLFGGGPRERYPLELPPIGDPLRPAAGTTLPTVAGPGFSDEPAYGDDHL
jgi:hypothetical protein